MKRVQINDDVGIVFAFAFSFHPARHANGFLISLKKMTKKHKFEDSIYASQYNSYKPTAPRCHSFVSSCCNC